MGFSSIMNPQYAALRALGIPAGHHDATRFVYFWAPPKSPAHDSARSWRCASGTRRARERDDAAGEGGDRLPGGRWRKDARARAARPGRDAEQSRQSARRAAKKAVKPPAPPPEPRMPLRDRVRASLLRRSA